MMSTVAGSQLNPGNPGKVSTQLELGAAAFVVLLLVWADHVGTFGSYIICLHWFVK